MFKISLENCEPSQRYGPDKISREEERKKKERKKERKKKKKNNDKNNSLPL